MGRSSTRKDVIRRRIWSLMEEKGISRFPKPVFGRIPNFAGAEKAALKLTEQREYQRADVVKVNPDAPQRRVRLAVLSDGKRLVEPTPRLRKGFMILDPHKLRRESYPRASTIKGSFEFGSKCPLVELPCVDLIVAGSVAVTEEGVRIGKGGGYSEMEYGILREIGSVVEETPIFTTVHDLQIVDEAPMEPHDLIMDVVITPTRVIKTKGGFKRPKGILWERLTERMMRDIPVLSELERIRKRTESSDPEA